MSIKEYENLATRIRSEALLMIYRSKSGHLGGALSIADLLAVLYEKILRVDPEKPDWPERDRFILSKGHVACAVYAVLAEKGFFPREWLKTYHQDGGHLSGHISHHVPGVEASTGSLGHGLPIGCGIALGAKYDQKEYRTFVLLSDGDCDEGSTWEAALFASQRKLDNLVAIVDFNKVQALGKMKDVLDLEPLGEKWKSFGWAVEEIDGHDYAQAEKSLLSLPLEKGKPSCLVAHTVKGKGISFMEGEVAWHYKHPDKEQLKKAFSELGVTYEEGI